MLWLHSRQCLGRQTMMGNQLGGVTATQLSLNNKPMQYVSGGVRACVRACIRCVRVGVRACVYLYR